MKLLITAIRQSRCGFNYKISFLDLSRVYNMLELSRVKLYLNDLKGHKNYQELAGVFLDYSKCEKEIRGKSTLVRVSEKFELARVGVIGSQLHPLPKFYFSSIIIFNLHKTKVSSTAEYE